MNPNEKLFKDAIDRVQFQQNILADNLVRLVARVDELEKALDESKVAK